MQILFFGALLSAILSTCSGAMLAPATVVGENLVRPLFKDVTDAQLLRIMRLSVVGVAIVTGSMALIRNNIYELVGESSALSLVSLFTPLIAGLYWKKASAAGAVISMIGGMVVWFVALLLLPEEPSGAESSSLVGTSADALRTGSRHSRHGRRQLAISGTAGGWGWKFAATVRSR